MADRDRSEVEAAVERLRTDCEDEVLGKERIAIDVRTVLAELERLRARVEELEHSREMACVEPPDNCDCAGCSYARDYYAALASVEGGE